MNKTEITLVLFKQNSGGPLRCFAIIGKPGRRGGGVLGNIVECRIVARAGIVQSLMLTLFNGLARLFSTPAFFSKDTCLFKGASHALVFIAASVKHLGP